MSFFVDLNRILLGAAPGTVYLRSDRWNDYSFVTMFMMSVVDREGVVVELGNVKIGFSGQTTEYPTVSQIPPTFESLDEGFFSLGQSEDFYKRAHALGRDIYGPVLAGLKDVVLNSRALDVALSEDVFSSSLMRGTSLATVKGAYARILDGRAPLTDFSFAFHRSAGHDAARFSLGFEVVREALPRSNIHALIGRNGVGKTTILNDMIHAIRDLRGGAARFTQREWNFDRELTPDYFSRLISVAFSAFDPFPRAPDRSDPALGTCYSYIGLKHAGHVGALKTLREQRYECAVHLATCFSDSGRAKRWTDAIERLASDKGFEAMQLDRLHERFVETAHRTGYQSDSEQFVKAYLASIEASLESMSSGHAIVFLTMTALVATVEEKTLVLVDEPESHLHPPLLSAFLRALSELLHERNGVAIVATHSPVVLQEIPKSCVFKILRIDGTQTAVRPDIETFGENVGTLTSEVFALEVEQSGFHEVLEKEVLSGGDYDAILARFGGQVGFEGRAILKVLLARRDGGLLR